MFRVLLCLLIGVAGFSVRAEPAPDFSLPTLRGSEILRLSSLRGKVVYIDFWASWCAPCAVSLPEISLLYYQVSDQNFEVVAINLDQSKSEASRFINKISPPYPVLFDAEKTTPKQYSVSAMPMAFLIDKKGQVRVRYKGYQSGDHNKLYSDIQQLLKEP